MKKKINKNQYKNIYLTKKFDNETLANEGEISSIESFLSSETGIFHAPAK